jgi:hypothetical protein
MTAKELISELQSIIASRAGEDIEVRMDVDSNKLYGVWSVEALGDDVVILSSVEAEQASLDYVKLQIWPPARPELN